MFWQKLGLFNQLPLKPSAFDDPGYTLGFKRTVTPDIFFSFIFFLDFIQIYYTVFIPAVIQGWA
jgi:hypothetical protein